jgi:hypothetical protein
MPRWSFARTSLIARASHPPDRERLAWNLTIGIKETPELPFLAC